MATPSLTVTSSGASKRIEDPIRIEVFTARIRALQWNDDHRRESLQAVFDAISGLAQAEIAYYYKRRLGSRLRSRLCRIGAWGFGTVGVLVPVLKPWAPAGFADFLSLGYVAFALAGALLLADTNFAGTNAFQRHVQAQLMIEHLYTVFAMEWQELMLGVDSALSNASVATQALILRARQFVGDLHKALGSETEDWKSDMDAALKELRKQGAKQGHS